MKKLLLSAAVACIFFVLAAPAFSATTFSFAGNLGFIYIDNRAATYSGVSIGDPFSGSITYGDSETDASSIVINAPISADYLFTGSPYGGTFTNGSTEINTTGATSAVGIGNNDSMGDDAAIINDLYGAGSTTMSTVADVWVADSFNSTYSFGVSLYSLDTSLYPGLSFQRLPPSLSETDFEIFYVEEYDTQGNTIFMAAGIVNSASASPVPVPAAFWLFGSGLLGLTGIAIKKDNLTELHSCMAAFWPLFSFLECPKLRRMSEAAALLPFASRRGTASSVLGSTPCANIRNC